jgi:hypothetical protein
MADANDNSGLKPDDIIGRVVPQGGNPDVKTLTGVFLGESGRAGYWRLYTSINLDRYFEFPKENALGAERFPSHQIVVWLKPETRVDMMTSTSAPVDFLQGKLASRHLSGRSLALPVGGGGGGGLGCCRSNPYTTEDDPNCHHSPAGPECIPPSYADNPNCHPN